MGARLGVVLATLVCALGCSIDVAGLREDDAGAAHPPAP
jgi:hypothetical protein